MKSVFVRTIIVLVLISWMVPPAMSQQINIVACRDGDTRLCGSSVGECEKGTTSCQGGIWAECIGGTGPGEEDCSDGMDNDCNGLVDDCGFNTVSIILIGSGMMLLIVALILSRIGK